MPEPANPQSINRYSYTLGNPCKYVDPSGHFTEEELINWGIYTAEELRWLAEYQSNWYNLLMEAVAGDGFAFAREGAGGVGQFLPDDQGGLQIGGVFWTEETGLRAQGDFRDWSSAVGGANLQRGILVPEQRVFSNLPNPHVQLSSRAEEINAQIVLGIDLASTLVSLFGYGIMVIDTLACPVDPTGRAFGYAVTQVGSGMATLPLIDTLITSGPNSWGFAVSLATYTAGWSSLPLWAPLDLVAAGSQLGYDAYALRRIQMRTRK